MAPIKKYIPKEKNIIKLNEYIKKKKLEKKI